MWDIDETFIAEALRWLRDRMARKPDPPSWLGRTLSQEFLQDLEDLRDLRAAKLDEGDAPTVSIDEAKKVLGV